MNKKRKYTNYSPEFKNDAVALVTDQGYSVADAAKALNVHPNLIYKWKQSVEKSKDGGLTFDERAELIKLRAENRTLKMEKEILKKASGFLRKGNEINFQMIQKITEEGYPKILCCKTLKVSRSGYYAWLGRPKVKINKSEFRLKSRMKSLFNESRESLGSRTLMESLRAEGFTVGRRKVRYLMRSLNLQVKQRIRYRLKRADNDQPKYAPNLVRMNFDPVSKNKIWVGDITYLKTLDGWYYLSVVMDLYSRRILGWDYSKMMTTDLVERSLQQAYTLRNCPKKVVFHSDRGSQYSSNQLKKFLSEKGFIQSMGSTGACWDNAVIERFFGSLKHDWLYKQKLLSPEAMKNGIAAYMRYYNLKRLHSYNGNMSPVDYENYKVKVSTAA
ncbi:IS3 family transposase [Ignatzschineria sp. LJL83]